MSVQAANTIVYGSSILLFFPGLVNSIFKPENKGVAFQDDFAGNYDTL
jgi:hypothetical protein